MVVAGISELKRWGRMMGIQLPKEFSKTVGSYLNSLASESRKEAVTKTLPKNFTIRNTFTASTVQFQKVGSFDINKMTSTMGQVARHRGKDTDFLGVHETGGMIAPKKGNKVLKKATRAGRVSKTYRKSTSRKSRKTFTRTLSDGRVGIFVRDKKSIKMIANISEKTQTVSKKPWMSQAVDATTKRSEAIFINSTIEMINRLKKKNRF